MSKTPSKSSTNGFDAGEMAELVRLAGREIRRVSREVAEESGRAMLPPHQQRALRAVGQEPIRPARLAELLRITPRAVTDVVDALVGAQFVTREQDPGDRRAQIVTITDAGRAELKVSEGHRHEAARRVFAGLEVGEAEQLAETLAKVLRG